MEINHKIEIDLLEFSKSGKFDVVKTGQTRDWILNNFPNPDDFEDGVSWRKGEFEIFTYGDFELHFSNDILYLIFADFIGKINEGKSLSFTNKWIFEKETSEISLTYVMDELSKKKIAYSTKRNDELFSIALRTNENVEMHFESDESTNPSGYFFSAISVMDKSIFNKKERPL